jgi:hypothetical protein
MVCPTESDCSLFTDAISRAADVDWFEGLGFDCLAITHLVTPLGLQGTWREIVPWANDENTLTFPYAGIVGSFAPQDHLNLM